MGRIWGSWSIQDPLYVFVQFPQKRNHGIFSTAKLMAPQLFKIMFWSGHIHEDRACVWVDESGIPDSLRNKMSPDMAEVLALVAEAGGGCITFDWVRQVYLAKHDGKEKEFQVILIYSNNVYKCVGPQARLLQ